MSGRNVLIIVVVIALIILGALGTIAYRAWSDWTSPWGSPEDQFLVEIERGMTAEEIADLLMERGVLKGKTFFLIMADLQGFGGSLKAGEYMVRGDQSPNDVVKMIGQGLIYRHPILFTEGVTREEIAQILERNNICSAEAFLKASGGGVYQDLQGGRVSTSSVEGFLFPDTYHLEKGCEPERIVDRMIRRFNQVYTELLEQVPEQERWWQIEEGSSVVTLVTLASLVEREAQNPEDRPLVASVFRNRLKKDMPLQSEATVRYIIRDWKRPLTKQDFKVDSPYNTFKNNGLPPTPICNPGRESLLAAMRPAQTNYLYFMATGNGKTEFSETLIDHNRMRQRVRRQRTQEQGGS